MRRATRKAVGTVHLVGAGPGDPGLLTLRAAELLARADVVVHDRLVHPDVLRRARSGARLIFVGKQGGGEQVAQDEITALLIAQARLGREVVRLKGGDPFVFGRGGEEALALAAAQVPFTIVPGVSSGVAAPAYAGIPVTHREVASAVTFATAHKGAGDSHWAHLAQAPTLVLFMGGRKLTEVVQALVANGRAGSTPAAIVEAGSWEHQRVLEGTLATLPSLGPVGSPALIVVGEVVRLRGALGAWAELREKPVASVEARR